MYYKRIQRVNETYASSKGVIEEIVVSFNSDISRHEQKLYKISQKIGALSSKSEEISKKIKTRDDQIMTLHAETEGFSRIEQRIATRFEEIGQKMENTSNVQETIRQKIEDLEKSKQIQHGISKPETEGVLPIKKEIALAPLTATELKVLETIASEGEKTAPQIRGRVELSREHTSRLMRKLYENGYLERDTRRAPYVYRLKKEMARILNK